MIENLINSVAVVQKICEATDSQLLKFEMDEGDINEVTIRLRLSPSIRNLAIAEERDVSKLRQIEKVVNN